MTGHDVCLDDACVMRKMVAGKDAFWAIVYRIGERAFSVYFFKKCWGI